MTGALSPPAGLSSALCQAPADWCHSPRVEALASGPEGSILRNANNIQYCHLEIANAHIHVLPKLD
jgi:hypothetical protein